jgi:hypothetical protein
VPTTRRSAPSPVGTASCSASSTGQSTEHGAQPWAALRERLAGEPWAATALALVDSEDPEIEPLADDLPRSLEQLRAAPERHDAMRVLGRI